MSNQHQYKGALFAAIAGIMWAMLAVALKITLHRYQLSPFTIVWFRFSLAFVLLAIILLFRNPGHFLVFKRPPLKLVGASVCLGFNYYGYMRGLDYTSPSNAQVFGQAGPLFFAIAGIIIFKEKISWKHILGFFTVIIGFSLFYWDQTGDFGSDKNFFLGVTWILVSALIWVLYAIWQKGLTSGYSTNQLNLFIYGICSLLFLPGAKFAGFAGLDALGWILVIFLGLNTLIAYGAVALAFKYLEANKVSVILTLNPIITFAIMYVFYLLNIQLIAFEHFTIKGIVGAIIAISGSAFVIFFTRQRAQK